jgi:hypothetical protein
MDGKTQFFIKYGKLDNARHYATNVPLMSEHMSKNDHITAAHMALDRIKKEAPTEYRAAVQKHADSAIEHKNTDAMSELISATHNYIAPYDKKNHKYLRDYNEFHGLLTQDHLHKIYDAVPVPTYDKEAIFDHPNVSASLIRKGYLHSSHNIRKAAIGHQNAPHDLIKQAAKEDPDERVRTEARRVAKARRIKLNG